jgi:hypothetical protein
VMSVPTTISLDGATDDVIVVPVVVGVVDTTVVDASAPVVATIDDDVIGAAAVVVDTSVDDEGPEDFAPPQLTSTPHRAITPRDRRSARTSLRRHTRRSKPTCHAFSTGWADSSTGDAPTTSLLSPDQAHHRANHRRGTEPNVTSADNVC